MKRACFYCGDTDGHLLITVLGIEEPVYQCGGCGQQFTHDDVTGKSRWLPGPLYVHEFSGSINLKDLEKR